MFEHTQKRAAGSRREDWRPLVVCPDAKMAQQIRSALSEQGFEEIVLLPHYPRSGEVVDLTPRHQFNICFLDVASNPEQALLMVGETAAVMPVVALNPCNDADLILRCLRRGACEFLSECTSEQVGGVLERLTRHRTPPAPQKASRVYCVMPGKAGCGASTVAAYLAMELRRSGMPKVLLVDTDLVAASIGFLFKLKSDFHLGDAVRDWNRMDDDLWGRLTVPYQSVDILLAPQTPATDVEIEREAAEGLVSFWRHRYDCVLLDLPGAHSAGFMFASVCDEVLLVTTNELASLHCTRRTLECLEKVSVEKSRIKLLVTRYTPSTGLKRDDVQTALKLEPWALLSNDYEGVQAALFEGKPVAPGSYFGRSLRSVAERLIGKAEPPKKRASFFGMLSIPHLSRDASSGSVESIVKLGLPADGPEARDCYCLRRRCFPGFSGEPNATLLKEVLE